MTGVSTLGGKESPCSPSGDTDSAASSLVLRTEGGKATSTRHHVDGAAGEATAAVEQRATDDAGAPALLTTGSVASHANHTTSVAGAPNPVQPSFIQHVFSQYSGQNSEHPT